jgi:hypothetical protein
MLGRGGKNVWNNGSKYTEIPLNLLPISDNGTPFELYAWFGRVGNQPIAEGGNWGLNLSKQYFTGDGYQVMIPKQFL